MSTLAYAATTEQREDAAPGTSTSKEKPGLGTWIDVVAALVPAEVLAIHALVLNWAVKTGEDADGNPVTTITDPSFLKVVFWVLVALALALYLIKKRDLVRLDVVRAAIPPVAFVFWTMLLQASAFDAVFPGLADNTRYFVAVVGAVLIAAIAQRLAVAADSEQH